MSLEDQMKTDCFAAMVDPDSDMYDAELQSLLNKMDKEGALNKAPAKPKSKLAKFADVMFEYYVNNLLGGITTQLKNAISTTVPLTLRVPETLTAATISKFAGKGEKVYFQEALAEAQGLVEGGSDVMKFLHKRFNAKENLKLRNEDILEQMNIPSKLSTQSKIEFKKRAITGENIDDEILKHAVNYVGAGVNIPSKTLTTVDVLFKIMNYRAATAKYAMRQTMEEGLSGQQGNNRYQQLLNDVRRQRSKNLENKGIDDADYRVYTDRPEGRWNIWMAEKGHDSPGMRWIVPFRRTMVNVLNYGIERSPLGLGLSKTRRMIRHGSNAERSEALSRMSLGTLIIGSMYGRFADRISGEAPHNKQERDIWEGQGHKQDTFRIGNQFIPLDAFGQVGPFLKGLARYSEFASNRANTPEAEELETSIAEEMVVAIADSMLQEHWLPNITGIASSIERAMRENRLDPIYREVADLGASFVPRPFDMYQKATDKTEYSTVDLWDRIIEKIPTLANGMLEPELNLYGEPMRHDRFKKQYPKDRVFDEIMRLKVPIPQAERNPMQTQMNPEEYTQYMKLAGQGGHGIPPMKVQLTGLLVSDYYKSLKFDEGKVAAIRRVIKQNRAWAKEFMIWETEWGKKARANAEERNRKKHATK